MTEKLPAELVDLLQGPSPCFVATLMPDGSPQLTETWVTTDGEHVVINIVGGMQKAKNIARDPRVAVNVADPNNPSFYWGVRGHVVETTTDGAVDSINELAHKYLGRDYPDPNPSNRLLVKIAVTSIAHDPRGAWG